MGSRDFRISFHLPRCLLPIHAHTVALTPNLTWNSFANYFMKTSSQLFCQKLFLFVNILEICCVNYFVFLSFGGLVSNVITKMPLASAFPSCMAHQEKLAKQLKHGNILASLPQNPNEMLANEFHAEKFSGNNQKFKSMRRTRTDKIKGIPRNENSNWLYWNFSP